VWACSGLEPAVEAWRDEPSPGCTDTETGSFGYIAYNLKSKNSNVHDHIHRRQTTNLTISQ